jgi:hypothetical protein
MHIPIKNSNGSKVVTLGRSTRGGSILLLNKIKTKPLPEGISGGAILSNRIVGVISNPTKPPQSNSLANSAVGGSIIDFSKHVKANARNIQKKRDTEENIKFVY